MIEYEMCFTLVKGETSSCTRRRQVTLPAQITLSPPRKGRIQASDITDIRVGQNVVKVCAAV